MKNKLDNNEMLQSLEVIPRLPGGHPETYTAEFRAEIIEYLKNPCVVELRHSRSDGQFTNHGERYAIGLVNPQYQNMDHAGIRLVGIDTGSNTHCTLNDLLNGERRYHTYNYDNQEIEISDSVDVITYLGRLNELDVPAQKSEVFDWEIKNYQSDQIEH